MKFLRYNVTKVKEDVYFDGISVLCRISEKDFTRNRKIKARDIIMYNFNNRGKTNKMELYDFINEYDLNSISSPGFLKQREKLDPIIFKILNERSLADFYNKFPDEVKDYKGYILCAIDGSDCEVPNSKETRRRYKPVNSKAYDRVARIKLSNCYDVLNKRVMDTEVEEYKHSETELAKRHIYLTSNYIENYECIYIMDRGYFSLELLYDFTKEGILFVMRLKKAFLKKEQKMMKSNDEEVEIQYQYDRNRHYKDIYPELYWFYEKGNKIKIRLVNIELPTGEIETIMTNLPFEKFSSDDIKNIYQKRWGIETSYHELKESMQITNISSSKDVIIKQEIYSQMMVYNIIQSIIIEAESRINQKKYKHKMKINFNMAVGHTKRMFVKLLIEEDREKSMKMYDDLIERYLENLVPIIKDRHYERKQYSKNKYSINKRKSY